MVLLNNADWKTQVLIKKLIGNYKLNNITNKRRAIIFSSKIQGTKRNEVTKSILFYL